jgi:uncharacterized protein
MPNTDPYGSDLPGKLLRWYKRLLSPLIGQQCRFYPSCSEYGAQCVRKHGWVKGSYLSIHRICRCQPWGEAGFDPAPEIFHWRGSKVQKP